MKENIIINSKIASFEATGFRRENNMVASLLYGSMIAFLAVYVGLGMAVSLQKQHNK